MALVSVGAMLGKVGDAMKHVETREELIEELYHIGKKMQNELNHWGTDNEDISDPVMFDGKAYTVRLPDCDSEYVYCDYPHLCFECTSTHLFIDGKRVAKYVGKDELQRLLQKVIP